MKPIFIFSLPRTGSTLLQRVLSAHNEVSSVAEPWVLLPLLYSLRKNGAYSEYGNNLMVSAVEDFCSELPNGRDDYLFEIRECVLRLYQKVSKSSDSPSYFLDKTPRYHLVADDIVQMFPDGKFILLWRHPLSVI